VERGGGEEVARKVRVGWKVEGRTISKFFFDRKVLYYCIIGVLVRRTLLSHVRGVHVAKRVSGKAASSVLESRVDVSMMELSCGR
jgi:hypothetical protein